MNQTISNPALSEKKIKRIRTIPGFLREIKKLDPDTSINISIMERLIREGTIPYQNVGRKRLIDMDKTLEILGGLLEEEI